MEHKHKNVMQSGHVASKSLSFGKQAKTRFPRAKPNNPKAPEAPKIKLQGRYSEHR
jgi:hypothetical protein